VTRRVVCLVIVVLVRGPAFISGSEQRPAETRDNTVSIPSYTDAEGRFAIAVLVERPRPLTAPEFQTHPF